MIFLGTDASQKTHVRRRFLNPHPLPLRTQLDVPQAMLFAA